MFVVVWEPTEGFGGGCQSVSDQRQAEQIAASLQRQRPDCMVQVMPAASTVPRRLSSVSVFGQPIARLDRGLLSGIAFNITSSTAMQT